MKQADRNFWQRFWRDPDGRIVLWQRPNWLLAIWLAATILNWLVSSSSVSSYISYVATLTLGAWAMLEIGWGVNYFRRLLGLVVLIAVLWP